MVACGTVGLFVVCDGRDRLLEERDVERLQKGISTEIDVRAVMGVPDSVHEEAAGGCTLEYPKGPQGVRTWMFRIAADGMLTDYQQVLINENFERVHRGMSRDEVRRLLGRPRSVMQFKRKNEEVWDWKYLDAHEERLFNVHFAMNSGTVVVTSISEIAGY